MARPASASQALGRLERAEAIGEPTQVFEPAFEPTRPQPTPPPSRTYTQASSRGSRMGAAAAILGVLAAVLVVALVVLGGGNEGKGQKAAHAKQAKASSKKHPSHRTETLTTAEAPPPAPEPAAETSEASPESGAALNEQGYAMVQAGEYEAAVPVLEEAVGSFPEGSEDVNYAYALFNLGHALRLSGHPEEAIPILEQRLQIPNQTATVEAELQAARAEAGG
jgi:tetratricopeptide (TPR) repeat protein